MLFAEGGEDEVGIGNGQEVALRLRALVGSLAPKSSRTDRDLGLSNLVARTSRIGIRIDERCQPRLLIGLQDLAAAPHGSADQRKAQQQDNRLAQGQASEKEARDQNRRVGQGRAQVGLNQHQQHRNADQREGLEDIRPAQTSASDDDHPEEPRCYNNQHELHPL